MPRGIFSLRFCAALFLLSFGWNFGISPTLKSVSADLSKVWKFDSSDWFTLTDDGTGIISYDGPKGTAENPVNITIPNGVTAIPAGVFDDIYIDTLVIPASVDTIDPNAFYGVEDTLTLVVEGDFAWFWDKIFPAIVTSYQNSAVNNSTVSVPTKIVVDGVEYATNPQNFDGFGGFKQEGSVYYYTNGGESRYTKSSKRAAFYYDHGRYKKNVN